MAPLYSSYNRGTPPCFGRHVKSLVPDAFAVVSTHQPALGPRGLWLVLLWSSLELESIREACALAVKIKRLMMIMYIIRFVKDRRILDGIKSKDHRTYE
jgi:hypothetical protein